MNGFLVFLTLVIAQASWGGYRLPLPGIHSTGEWITITSDAACPYRVISADIEMSNNPINPWTNLIRFDEQGEVKELRISCPCSIIETPVDKVPVDWLVR